MTFSREQMDGLLGSRGLAIVDVQPFITVAGALGAEDYSVGSSPLHTRPLVQVEDNFILAEPGILIATIRHAVVSLAKERGALRELAVRYGGAVWDTVKQNLRYLGLEQLPVSLPRLSEGVQLTEGVFDLDRDKALYVQLVVDPLIDYDTDEVFGTWEAKDLGTTLDARLHAVEQSLLARTSALNEVLGLTVLGGVGRRVMMGIGTKSAPPLSLHLAIPAHDLETMTLLEGGQQARSTSICAGLRSNKGTNRR